MSRRPTRAASICHAPRCTERVDRGKLMCRGHWFALPPELRRAISDSWKQRRLADWSANCLEARRVLAERAARPTPTPTPVSPQRAFAMNARLLGERND